jgi:hypothetical protein
MLRLLLVFHDGAISGGPEISGARGKILKGALSIAKILLYQHINY